MTPVFFYVFAALAIAFSLVVILHKNPISSAFSLVLVFFCFAGLYALMSAHLIATLQILVYAGAIMVLFLFVIMLLNADVPSQDLAQTPLFIKITAVLSVAALTSLFVWVFHSSPLTATRGGFGEKTVESLGGNTQVVSKMLFSTYLLPFEITSFLLLTGIVAAVTIAKRKRDGGGL